MSVVTGQCTPSITMNQTPTSGFFTGQALSIPLTLQAIFKASGLTADQVDLVHAKTYTFASSTAQTLDLTALLDVLGAAVSFARVRLLAIRVRSTTDAASLTIGGAATNEWAGFLSAAGTLKVFPSTANADSTLNNHGFFLLSAPNTTGIPVSGTSKNLKLLPSAHAFDVDVIIAGCSA